MRFQIALALPLASLAACSTEGYISPRGFKPVVVSRPDEPKATYTLLDAWREGSVVLFVTKREGPSGINYTRRQIDCSSGIGRTLGLGETVAEMMQERPDPNAIVPVRGSSAQLTSAAACQAVGAST